MRFFSAAASFALAVFTAGAFGQLPTSPNAITSPTAGTIFQAGQTYDIKWINPKGAPVTLVLQDGPSGSLQTVLTIASNIANSGSYSWTVPTTVPEGTSYTVRISYDDVPADYNYSPQFTIMSSVTATSSASGSSTSASASTSAPSTSAKSTTATSSSSESSKSSSASTTASATSSGSSSKATSTASVLSTSSSNSTTVRTSTTAKITTSAPTVATTGAPPSAANSNLSSSLAVIMAVLAAAIFLH